MTVFTSTLSQMGFLAVLIVIGYVLTRFELLPDNSTAVLSKLENYVFIPCLVLGTFMQNFTVQSLNYAWQYVLCGLVTVTVSVPVAIFVSKAASRDKFIQNTYTYGLSFSNFGFMGNAVVSALFPDIFDEYLIFVLPFWIYIYVWGVPSLLMPHEEGKITLLGRLKPLLNPMFIGMLVGIVIGLCDIPTPQFLTSSISTLGACMSPVAMLLTGMTVAKTDLITMFKMPSVYVVSAVRLLIMPLFAVLLFAFWELPYGLMLCTVCSLAMPLGLNTIVVPNAYGRDTTVAASMALISHLASIGTIPLIFMLFETVVK
ncbi:MAG: AEC family transporter [Clostridia bacterium]|nr:AEC family transporter [Clostridia bacterium]